MIDIQSILSENNVPFETKGPNVGRNAIAIACPFCAENNNPDPSTHLRIRLNNNHWNCWRNKSHRGIDIYRLLSKLGIEIAIYNETTLDQIVNNTFFIDDKESNVTSYQSVSIEDFPSEFVSIGTKLADKNYYKPYLVSRGFTNIESLISKYNLMRSMDSHSKWSWRIIAPIHMETEVTWVGRSIFNEERIKYLTPSPNEALNVKYSLFNYKELIQSVEPLDYIFITEGYIDALKLDFYGPTNIRATSVFGVNTTEIQIKLIRYLSQRCKHMVVAFDNDAIDEGFKLWQSLSEIDPIISKPPSKKDWGEMTESEIIEFKQTFLEK